MRTEDFIGEPCAEKLCSRCNTVKPAVEFTRNKARRDGLKVWCKPCVAAYEAARMEPSRIGRPEKLSGEALRIRAAMWRRNYRTRHKAKIKADRQVRRTANRESERRQTRGYYWRHPERQRERVREYFAKYPQKRRAYAALRRATKIRVHVERVDYEAIKVRDQMICHICRKPVTEAALHFDHVVPLSKGGAHETENIAVSHARCNLSKGSRLVKLF